MCVNVCGQDMGRLSGDRYICASNRVLTLLCTSPPCQQPPHLCEGSVEGVLVEHHHTLVMQPLHNQVTNRCLARGCKAQRATEGQSAGHRHPLCWLLMTTPSRSCPSMPQQQLQGESDMSVATAGGCPRSNSAQPRPRTCPACNADNKRPLPPIRTQPSGARV